MLVKDIYKFEEAIDMDSNLNLEESRMICIMFRLYSIELGYAYPTYEELMKRMKTKRQAKISKTLKSLVDKGYINIEKIGRKNKYILVKHLYIRESNNKQSNKSQAKATDMKPVDSNGIKPVEGQVHIDEFINNDIQAIVKETGFSESQALSLLNKCERNVSSVLEAYTYSKGMKNVKNIFAYTYAIISSNIKIPKNKTTDSVNTTRFNNFKARDYDYDSLEKKLLGWDEDNELDIYQVAQ